MSSEDKLPWIVMSKKYRLNTMETAVWMTEWMATHNREWMTLADASHGLGYKDEWIRKCIRNVRGREWLYSHVVFKDDDRVAAYDVYNTAQHVTQADFLRYSGISPKTFRYTCRKYNIEIFASSIRGFKCIKFSDALDLLFWHKIKQLTSRYFSFSKAMQLKHLSLHFIQDYIISYNLRKSW